MKDICKYVFKRINSDYIAIKNLREERKINIENKFPIRVVFLVQYIPAWNKMESVYKKMINDSRFNVFLVCVPSGIQNQKLVNPNEMYNDTYDYFSNRGYSALNALVGKEEWLDLKSLNAQYVFCLRPYNAFMPICYSSHEISKYAKICVILYGYILSKNVLRVLMNRDFFSDVSYYFAESEYCKRYFNRRFKLGSFLGLQKSRFFGVPTFETILENRYNEAKSWGFANNHFRVLWTPRWTTDKNIGGSTFFKYKDELLSYAEAHPEISLLLRPHPLMFDNFLKSGEMTLEEIETYKRRFRQIKNVSIDEEEDYVATFWNSSVMVCDRSAMMLDYIVTGKPMIYCIVDCDFQDLETLEIIKSACYIARNKDEVFKYLDDLRNGYDYLKEKREGVIKILMGSEDIHFSDLVVKELVGENEK